MIVQELSHLQDTHGYLPKEELHRLSERLDEPLYRLHELASFFPHFRLQKPATLQVDVSRDMACRLRGSAGMRKGLEALQEEFGAERLAVCGVSCLGRCDRAPAVAVTTPQHPGHATR